MPGAERTAARADGDGRRRGPGAPIELTVVASLGGPAAARAAVAGWMAGYVSETTLADAQLVVGELVANSVRHADAPADAVIRIRAAAQDGVVRLEVADRGERGSIVRRAPDLQRGGGFGLNLVEMLARRWGVDRNDGTCVWAELAFSENGASENGGYREADDGARTR